MATKYQRGGSWYLQFTDENGQRRRPALGKITEAEAERARKRVEQQNTVAARIFQLRRSPTLSDFAPNYLAWYATEHPASYARAKDIIERVLLPAFGTLPLPQIKPMDAESWKAERAQQINGRNGHRNGAKVAPTTVTKELRTLKAMLNRAVDWEVIDRNPIARVREPKDVRSKPFPFYTAEQLAAIYEASDETRWVWKFTANTGMRLSELMNVRGEHISKGRVLILSDEAARTKSGKWREVPLGPSALEAVEHLPDKGAIVPDIHKNSVGRQFRRHARIAGPGGSIHWLRHTFCSHLVMQGIDLRTVQKLAGHASYSTTERYAHLAPGHLRKATSDLRL